MRGSSKRLLRQAFASELPASVFKRKKSGFAVPLGDWLRTSLRPMLNDLLSSAGSLATDHVPRVVIDRMLTEHQSRRADHSHRLYALLMLELWRRSAEPPR
jgi:asparagine synthase (glutamine-hydrolysing)